MIAWSLTEIAGIVDGVVHDDPDGVVVTGPAFIDTRTPESGGLFAAFVGENADGHDHARAAVDAGAVAILGSRPVGVPAVVVGDVQAALQSLAAELLRRLRAGGTISVLALTGSQGKTSTKDLLARILAAQAPTVATAGSFNNEIGLPLTVLRADADTRFLVLEMGSRGIGHLRELCEIAPPDVSVVLNVGLAHLGEFGSRENIALAKGELVEALTDAGVAVLNLDDPRVAAMRERTTARVIGFTEQDEAQSGAGPDDIRVIGLEVDAFDRASFSLEQAGVRAQVRLQILGRHQASNAAAAAAAATAVGVSLPDVAAALSEVTALSRWRMELTERDDGLVVINDAYNANPDSMRAALHTLHDIGQRAGRRTIAVLGEMRELGPTAADEHAAVGDLADTLGIDQVLVVGVEAAAIGGNVTHHVASVTDALDWLRQNVLRDDVVLVKASRGARLERVADGLLEEGGKR